MTHVTAIILLRNNNKPIVSQTFSVHQQCKYKKIIYYILIYTPYISPYIKKL